ncbi:phage tail protein, partial [Carnimonas bestiolae]|uniref:phage tail protein n=1 Tax=Carnimonas bestiolae TaxID=3402172 RepID=UPI003F4AF35D
LISRLGVSESELIDDMFINAANVCDESVSLPDGGSEPRYRVGGRIKADDAKTKALKGFEDAIGGHLIRIGGKFGVIAGAYYGPAEITVTEDMLIGTLTGQIEPSSDDSKNSISGKWNDPNQLYVETSYPTVRVEEWVQEDGGVDEDTLDLPMVPSSYQCQRLANMVLRGNRTAGPFTLPLNHRGYACRPGQVINIDLPSLNISGEFRVTDWKFGLTEGCQITVRAEEQRIYDDA